MTHEEETKIGETSTLTLKLVFLIITLLVAGAGSTITTIVIYNNARHQDLRESREGRDEIMAAIQSLKDSQAKVAQELKDAQLSYQTKTDGAIRNLQNNQSNSLALPVFAIWVLECQKANNTFVDPGPIIDRYLK